MKFDYFKFLRYKVSEKQWKCQLPCGREEMMCGFLDGIYSSSCLHAKGSYFTRLIWNFWV